MKFEIIASVAGIALAMLAADHARAQDTLSAGVEAMNDERRRGLSWSDGDASISGDLYATWRGIEAEARVAALRGSSRHAGADAVADLTIGTSWNLADLTLRARGVAHIFAGADRGMDYVEIGGTLGYLIGPVQFDAGADYAPSQDAIGGDNLYLRAGARSGIPGTSLTVVTGIGRSSGSGSGETARRLRPDGSYVDWRLGVEHIDGPLVVGLDYLGTDVRDDAPRWRYGDLGNSGDRVVLRARYGF